MNKRTDNPQFELATFSGKIHLIENDKELEHFFSKINNSNLLGFDTETRPSFKKGDVFKMALLQLSNETDAYLIRLHTINDYTPIKILLENKQITKIGLAIRDDIKGLQKLFPFEPQSFVELQEIAKTRGLKNFGLKGMCEEVLNLGLSKKAKLSNWENKTLSTEQLNYAATDAWIGLKIFQKLNT
jgi:ribonuclease D